MSRAILEPKHVERRLGERAPPAAAERGFALLRDPAALARFLTRLGLHDDALACADSIALALAPGDSPPHMLVRREGRGIRGITCLGPGMAFAAPVVPYAEVQAFLDARAEALRAHMAFQRLDKDPATRSPLMRLIKRPHRITRGEFLLLRDLTPLMGDFYDEVVRSQVDLILRFKSRRARIPKGGQLLRDTFALYQAAMIAIMAGGHDEQLEDACMRAAACGDVLLAVRGLWMAVHHPERTLAYAERAIVRNRPVFTGLLFAFAGITARFPAWRKDAMSLSRHMSRQQGRPGTGDAWAEHLAHLGPDAPGIREPLLRLLPALLIRIAPPELIRAGESKEHVDALLAKLQEPGVSLLELAATLSPWHVDAITRFKPFDGLTEPVRLVPRGDAGRGEEELYREALFRCLWRDLTMPLHQLGMLLPVLAAGTPVEALTPGDKLEPTARPDIAGRYLTLLLPRILDRPTLRKQPARAAPKPPRNAPCPCGSGRKYKRCCGS